MARIKPLYKKNDVVYCIHDGHIFIVCLDGVHFCDGNFRYSINYEKYLEVKKSAIKRGLGDNIPDIEKGLTVLQEDLFKSMVVLEKVALECRKAFILCHIAENITGGKNGTV